ncbi:hypothetical protein ILUMI_15867 [Ignelater luminosus]|uniref:Uncharacterized protein n=1 Tax=Ignelater luminosus TaxID=2038154 RepID=A0A8K0CS88_IGNLU|nr:hypothetical protein ILUMI_15867 [Ignelater luminosus]
MSLRSKKILALAYQDIPTTGNSSEAYAHKEAPDEPFGDFSSSYEPSDMHETDSDSSPNRKQSKTTESVVEMNSLDQKIAKKRNRKPKKELWKRTINKKLRLSGKRNWKSVNLKHKYDAHLPVSQRQKQDLVYLLEKKVITVEYSNFIQSIPVAKGAAQLDREKSDD